MSKRVIVLGGDGFCGWPTALHLSEQGMEVAILDNFVRRQYDFELGCESATPIASLATRLDAYRERSGKEIKAYVANMLDAERLKAILQDFGPDAVVHFAEQRAAPYSMIDRRHAVYTQRNNVLGTLNLIYAIQDVAPDCHLIKLGTMGEYGTPNIDIEEGWLNVEHNGRKDRVLYPKSPGSWYHLSKVHDSANLEFACRIYGLRVTDLNQGVVYGATTPEIKVAQDERLVNRLDYDGTFGTALNRFCVQAVLDIPLTVYGTGKQTRAFINIVDTVRCIRIAVDNPAKRGEFRVFNQFTEQWSVMALAELVRKVGRERFGREVHIAQLENPRIEKEEHYYNAKNTELPALGLDPYLLTEDVVHSIMRHCLLYKTRCDPQVVKTGVKWKETDNAALSGFVARRGS